MTVLGLVASSIALAGGGAPPQSADASQLTALVIAIQQADYRGDRPELRRLSQALDAVKEPRLAAFKSYWRGFALWRRALNGFNETPTPADISADLEQGVADFHQALAEEPDWIEAKIGAAGCLGSLLFLAANDPARQQKLLVEYVPLIRDVFVKGAENPRALWLLGANQSLGRPPRGAEPAKAAGTYQKGLDLARREAEQSATVPAYVPTWGGAEHLMSLAYLYSHSSIQNPALARAYATGALVAKPQWHYVRDMLLPQIAELEKAH
jgi:hypothetical protein